MKYTLFIGALACLFLPGCQSSTSQDVSPEPVAFSHPDEVVRGDGFMVLADRRIFAVMAFLNAMGYDEEAKGQQMHPVRIKVRRAVANNLADKPRKLRAWRTYYRQRRVAIFQYKSFAFSLSADYPFRRIRPNRELGYPHTARPLKDFPELLNDFWVTAGLDEVWNQVKPDYIAEIRRYDLEKMKRQMSFLWEYLRMERSDPFVIVQVPDLLDRHFGAIGAAYGRHYYCVDNPGSHAYGLNVHEYLHSIVNPLVKVNHPRFKTRLNEYYMAGKDAPLSRHYREPATFVFECLVRALDRRVSVKFENDPKLTRIWQSQVANDTKEGLNLTQPFYFLLADYEESDKRFDKFIPVMLARLPRYSRPAD
jgi:hypothetical protein